MIISHPQTFENHIFYSSYCHVEWVIDNGWICLVVKAYFVVPRTTNKVDPNFFGEY